MIFLVSLMAGSQQKVPPLTHQSRQRCSVPWPAVPTQTIKERMRTGQPSNCHLSLLWFYFIQLETDTVNPFPPTWFRCRFSACVYSQTVLRISNAEKGVLHQKDWFNTGPKNLMVSNRAGEQRAEKCCRCLIEQCNNVALRA